MSYAIRNDGKGWRAVSSAGECQPNETFSETAPAASDAPSPLLAQIAALEVQITPRRVREALLTGDHSFVQSIDTQIAALRAQL